MCVPYTPPIRVVPEARTPYVWHLLALAVKHFILDSFSESDSTNSVNYYRNMTEMISLNKIHEYGSLINVVFMVI